jgi:hypothetical protein
MSSIGLSPQHSDKSALGRPDQGADLTEWLLYLKAYLGYELTKNYWEG